MNGLKELKDRLGKINSLLDKLDERLVQGELSEAKYKELSGKYKAEADGLKNQIAEKELLQEVGLKTGEKEEIEYPEEEPEKPVFREAKPPVSEKKSVALAVVLSFFIPGLGQIYCGRVARGAGILVLSILMFFIFGFTAASAGAASSAPVFPFLMWILVYIWNIYDAYKLAERINRGEA